MDAISMLGGQETPKSVDLSGLSPEEIRGVSAGRVSREQMMNQMVDRLSGFQQGRSTIAAQQAAQKLSETKERIAIEGAEPIELTDHTGKKFSIPKNSVIEGFRLINNMKRDAVQNKLNEAQTKALETTRPLTLNDKTENVSEAHYAAIAKAEENRKLAEQKAVAGEKIKNLSIEEMMQPENLSNAIIAAPNMVSAAVNKMVPFGKTLTPNEEIRFTGTLHNLGQTLLGTESSKRNPDPSNVETYNKLSSSLRTNHMMLSVKRKALLGDYTQAVTVPLPPNVTADMVYQKAKELGKPVSEILQTIYNNTQR